ncbi:MAG TPA: peptidoglycan DD-metalloendopeptidase family protein [Streptomyces sp.]|uniref:peptidoglycan DD-metalloendopeptidase family protein n=1 Tax=Streptomyces sp. TaxID=1931 RepID=UPI002D5FCE76|nr:peptidoglycan DD-metalloendopeptidase family protein [Streptomyces sp.]HZG03699.1 peptidoglycan DD-metalloendopeptidase family protein [Streptomyces sp.]
MNDRHLSGDSTPADPAADSSYGPYGSPYEPYEQPSYGVHGQQDTSYGDTSYGYVTGTFAPLGETYGDGDPLFGSLPGSTPAPPTAPQDDTWGQDTGQYPAYGAHDTYDTATWAHIPAQTTAPPDETWGQDTGQYPAYGAYDTTAWDDSGAYPTVVPEARPEPGAEHPEHPEYSEHPGEYPGHFEHTAVYEVPEAPDAPGAPEAHSPGGSPRTSPDGTNEPELPDFPEAPEDTASAGAPEAPGDPGSRAERPVRSAPPSARPAGSRRRRSARPKRSALLTVAVPSVCVMGVTAVAAASVSDIGDEGEDAPVQAAPDTSAIKTSVANRKLDTQLAGLSSEAEGFADRASRTQERIDLKERQEAERRRKEAEAARREAMRPKFALPVAQHGLSAYYGQAGINWMSLHTGIDFPVSYGTPVMAATDGTVRTQWNSAYGNMAIVTAPDGTETWYCHLSSTRIRSGQVKAGDIIAYSGNSGNSTGPHLHFEVRPGGGSAVDPLPWFRSKGLDPT